jgi:hypothetical protein
MNRVRPVGVRSREGWLLAGGERGDRRGRPLLGDLLRLLGSRPGFLGLGGLQGIQCFHDVLGRDSCAGAPLAAQFPRRSHEGHRPRVLVDEQDGERAWPSTTRCGGSRAGRSDTSIGRNSATAGVGGRLRQRERRARMATADVHGPIDFVLGDGVARVG